MTLFPNLLPTRGPSALVSTRQQLVHRGAPTLCTLPEELGAIFSYPTSDYANGELVVEKTIIVCSNYTKLKEKKGYRREIIDTFGVQISELNAISKNLNDLEATIFDHCLDNLKKVYQDVSKKYQEISEIATAEEIQEKTGFSERKHEEKLSEIYSMYAEYEKNREQEGSRKEVIGRFHDEIRVLEVNLDSLEKLEAAIQNRQKVYPGSTSDRPITRS